CVRFMRLLRYLDLEVMAHSCECDSRFCMFRPCFRMGFLLKDLYEVYCLWDALLGHSLLLGCSCGSKLLKVQVVILDGGRMVSVFAMVWLRGSGPLVDSCERFKYGCKPFFQLSVPGVISWWQLMWGVL